MALLKRVRRANPIPVKAFLPPFSRSALWWGLSLGTGCPIALHCRISCSFLWSTWCNHCWRQDTREDGAEVWCNTHTKVQQLPSPLSEVKRLCLYMPPLVTLSSPFLSQYSPWAEKQWDHSRVGRISPIVIRMVATCSSLPVPVGLSKQLQLKCYKQLFSVRATHSFISRPSSSFLFRQCSIWGLRSLLPLSIPHCTVEQLNNFAALQVIIGGDKFPLSERGVSRRFFPLLCSLQDLDKGSLSLSTWKLHSFSNRLDKQSNTSIWCTIN